MSQRPIPAEIRRQGERDVLIVWKDGHRSLYPARALRLKCPCAGCVDEWTGRRMLTADSVPEDISPDSVELVGRYAIRIRWSDGHSNGLYTFDLLRRLCPCPACRARQGRA